MKEGYAPSHLDADFEQGFKPDHDATELVKMAYRLWKEAGGQVKQETQPKCWAVVELLGHVKLAGRLTEEEKFGAKMGRLDIPEGDGFITQFFGGGSVYRITIVTEEVARQVNRNTSPSPVSAWDFPKRLEEQPQVSTRDFKADFDADEMGEDEEDNDNPFE